MLKQPSNRNTHTLTHTYTRLNYRKMLALRFTSMKLLLTMPSVMCSIQVQVVPNHTNSCLKELYRVR